MSLSKISLSGDDNIINENSVLRYYSKEFNETLAFTRREDFYKAWPEWNTTVSKYYSFDTVLFMDLLERGSSSNEAVNFNFDTGFNNMAFGCASVFCGSLHFWEKYDKIQFKTILSEIKYANRVYYPGDFDIELRNSLVSTTCPCVLDVWSAYEAERNCPDQVESHNPYPYEKCGLRHFHMMNIYIPMLVNLIKKTKQKSLKRYYKKIIRLIYSLNPERIIWEDVEKLIFEPCEVKPGNLLKYVYERHYFEKYTSETQQKIIDFCEYNKHFLKEQGCTSQSVSAVLFEDLAYVYQQGLGMKMVHELSSDERDKLFERFEETLMKTQNEFMKSVKESLVEISHYALTLFIIVATIALLGYSLIRLGEKIVFGTLNLMYRILCGNFFSKEDAIQQSGDGISIPLLPAMIVKNVISPPVDVASKVWNNTQVDRVMRRIGYLGDPKIQRGINNLTEWMKEMINNTVNWFSREILGLAVPEDINNTCSPVEAWYNETDAFLKTYWDQTMQWNDSTWSVLMNLYGKGTSLVRQKVFESFKQDIYKVLFKLANILEKFNARGRSGNSVRNPPVTLYLTGGTGVGKSSMTYPLAAEILKGIFAKEQSHVDLKKNWKNLIYMRSSEQEYWDGYENQLVTVFDDYNQMVDTAGNPNVELFEVIRASNSFPYPLHMASLDQKATTTFSSKIILVSSNLEQPKSVSLNFPEALWRRFDLSIKVTRKPGVTVDPSKFDPNIYNFQRYDMSTQSAGEFMSYKEVVFFAVTEYFKRKGFVDSVEKYINDTLAEMPDPALVQQSIGTAIGNSICFGKSVVKKTISTIKDNYLDLKASINDGFCYKEMSQLQIALSNLKGRMNTIREKWVFFRIQHPYMARVLQFLGLSALIFGIIKVLMHFTQSEEKKKEKVMSMEQFIKSNKVLPESCTDKDIKKICRLYSESYSPVLQKSLKVESYDEVKPLPIKVESYNPQIVKQLRAEGTFFEVMCPHEMASEPLFPMKRIFLKSCDDTCPNAIKSEGVKDINANEILGKLISHNYYKIYMSHNDEAIGHGMFLRGRVFMCPKHYINVFKKIAKIGGRIYFKNAFLTKSFEINVEDIMDKIFSYESPDDDAGNTLSRDIMAFPVASATVHANIEPFFSSKSSLSFVMKSQVLLPVIMEMNGSRLPVVGFHFTKGQSGLTIKESAIIKDDSGNVVRQMRDLWEYSMDTKSTYCGAPLIVRNTQIAPGKIIGMHVAGIPGTGLGFSTPVYKEDVSRILSKFSSFDTIEFRPELKLNEFPTEQSQVPVDSEFIRMGSVIRGVAQPGKSKIIPSPIYNRIREPKTRPCALRPVLIDGQTFDPRQYRLKRLGNIPVAVDQKMINIAKNAVIDEIASQIPRVSLGDNIKSVYSFEEAVVGIDGEPYINAVKRNTSPGYPYVHMPGFSNRKEIFGDDEKCDMRRPQSIILQSRVERIIKLAKQGVAIEHVFMDTLKDERKPLHKFHKTRLFSAGPIDYLIACKRYFNGIVAVLQKARNFSHISVGTDHNTMDWTVIARELMRKSKHMVAGDFEGFDASQSAPLLEAAGDILIALSMKFCGTTEEEAKVMKTLLIACFNSVHITDKEVYQWTHSLPSGHYLTAIINSIFVLLVFCICWMLAMKKVKYMVAREFFQKCGIVAFGDDHIVSVPESVLDIFNQMTIPDFMDQIGLGYTMEDKDREVDVKSRVITEISYLKRSFVFDVERHRWIAPLTLDTILESPMWLHKCPDKVTQMITQLDTQLRELSLHDEKTWDKWASVFADLGKQFGHYTVYVNQEETRTEVLSD